MTETGLNAKTSFGSLDENNKVIGTATKDNMLYANDSYTSSFPVRNNTMYRLEIKLNANSVSQKTYYNTVYVDCNKDEFITKPHITPMEAALMAEHIYLHNEHDNEVDRKITDSDWKLVDVWYGRETVKIGVYERGYANRPYTDPLECAIVNKGTTIPQTFNMNQIMESAINWQNNLEQMLSPKSADMWDSIERAKTFNKLYKDVPMTFVGHSKGGAESAMMAITVNKNAILFNPASPNFKDYGVGTNELNQYAANIDTYIVTGEALDYIYSVMKKNRIGKVHFLPMQYQIDEDINIYSFNDIERIDNMIMILKAMVQNHLMEAVKKGLSNQ